jgi:hypothetical protein
LGLQSKVKRLKKELKVAATAAGSMAMLALVAERLGSSGGFLMTIAGLIFFPGLLCETAIFGAHRRPPAIGPFTPDQTELFLFALVSFIFWGCVFVLLLYAFRPIFGLFSKNPLALPSRPDGSSDRSE